MLEVGAGEGECARACTTGWPGVKYTAVESNQESRAYYDSIDCRLVEQSLEQFIDGDTQERFDVILLFDLIEHLRDPEKTLGILVQKFLKSDSLVVATFPDASSGSRRWMGSLWPQYKLEHLYYFTPGAIESVEKRLHLKTHKLHSLEKTLPVEYLIQVGSHFGPAATQSITRGLSALVPGALKRRNIRLPLGELLWIAEKNS